MKTGLRFRAMVAVILAVVLVGGCTTPMFGPSVTYSYEPRFSFAELKTYRWIESRSYWGDPLLEANVRFLADRVLETKGYTSKADKADFLVSMRYEGYGYGQQQRIGLAGDGDGDDQNRRRLRRSEECG